MSSDRQTLLIRADASSRIGTGHVMRCLALAQAWEDTGGKALFMMVQGVPALAARLTAEGMEIVHISTRPGSAEDTQQTAIIAQQKGAAWVVADGYHFGADYQRAIKHAGLRMLLVDDYGHASHYCADLVLNQNISATESLYANREPYTRLLLGTRYALLRREFLRWRHWQRETMPVARKVLVTLGGGDPDNVTIKVIQGLQQAQVEGLEAVVVVGACNARFEELQSSIREAQLSIRLERDVANMPNLMAWAHVAVSAGGSTCWELAYMGLPSVIFVLADNQEGIAEGLDKAGVAVSLGWNGQISAERLGETLTQLALSLDLRQRMSCKGKSLVDGDGSRRVVEILQMKPDLASA